MKTDEKAYEDLLAERNELNVRISRLDHFCRNVHNISRLSLHQKALMGVQLQAMKTYREVLMMFGRKSRDFSHGMDRPL